MIAGYSAGTSGMHCSGTIGRWLASDDCTYGTYIIDRPGVYRLAEDISFNPNSPATLTEVVERDYIPAPLAGALGLATPVDAYQAGMPLFTQFTAGPAPPFTPGGPLDARAAGGMCVLVPALVFCVALDR